MDEGIRKVLARPFEKALVKERPGPGGQLFAYVEIGEYISRLNEAFGHDWSHEITRREQVDDQVIVEIRLSAAGVVKMGIGGSAVTRRRDNSELLSLAHDFMAAEATALKRACRLFGIGLDLYRDDEVSVAQPDYRDQPIPFVPTRRAVTALQPTAARARTGSKPNQNASSTEPATSANERGRISTAQLSKMRELVEELGVDWNNYRASVRERLGINVEYATRRVASDLIADLIARTRAGRTNGGSHAERRAP